METHYYRMGIDLHGKFRTAYTDVFPIKPLLRDECLRTN